MRLETIRTVRARLSERAMRWSRCARARYARQCRIDQDPDQIANTISTRQRQQQRVSARLDALVYSGMRVPAISGSDTARLRQQYRTSVVMRNVRLASRHATDRICRTPDQISRRIYRCARRCVARVYVKLVIVDLMRVACTDTVCVMRAYSCSDMSLTVFADAYAGVAGYVMSYAHQTDISQIQMKSTRPDSRRIRTDIRYRIRSVAYGSRRMDLADQLRLRSCSIGLDCRPW